MEEMDVNRVDFQTCYMQPSYNNQNKDCMIENDL